MPWDLYRKIEETESLDPKNFIKGVQSRKDKYFSSSKMVKPEYSHLHKLKLYVKSPDIYI